MTIPAQYRKYLMPGAVLLVGIVLGILLTYLPAPKLSEAPTTTKDSAVTIAGTVGAKLAVILMNKDGHVLLTTNADEKGMFRFTGVPVGEGETVLRLRAMNGGWRASRPVTLRISRDTTAPSLTMENAKGGTVTGANYLVSGKAEPGSTVTVNGVNVPVAGDGSWSTTLALKDGANAVTVTATDAAGNVTTATETVTYAPSATGATTGTATTTGESTTYSAGSQPPPPPGETTTNTNAATNTNTATGASTGVTNTNTSGGTPPQPASQPTSLVVTASTANLSPNARSTQQIYANVATNLGTHATAAVVTAVAHYKTGDVTYSLANAGNGTYVTSFKLGENAVSDHTVFVDVTATWNGLTGSGRTSFTPR